MSANRLLAPVDRNAIPEVTQRFRLNMDGILREHFSHPGYTRVRKDIHCRELSIVERSKVMLFLVCLPFTETPHKTSFVANLQRINFWS